MLFYKSDIGNCSYDQLIERINNMKHVQTSYLAENYIAFISNLIAGIINNVNPTLLDYRNIKEISDSSYSISQDVKVNSTEHLISLIKKSESSIGIFSSGTEGKPKLIFQPIQRLLKNVRVSNEYNNSRWALTYNPSHSAGIQLFLQVICNQASMIDLYKKNRKNILSHIAEDKIEYLSATPTFYRMLAPYDFICPYVKNITLNGEKSTQVLIDNIKISFPNARIRNIYGSTESGPFLSSDSSIFHVPEKHLGNIKIENDELFLHPNLVSKSAADDEWYATGDLVKVISSEPLAIEFISRKTRILNVGGQNVNPQEVEEVLLLHPSVKDVRVYGRYSTMIGQIVCADVQKHENNTDYDKDLIDYCRSKLANYKIPRIINFVQTIAAGNTGKKLI